MKIIGDNGYNICFDEFIPEACNTVLIAMHGFAGDRQSGCIQMLEDALKKENIGLIKFDWPAHGESEVAGECLTIDNCLTDLNSIVKYVRQKNSNCKIMAFSTSFGGYLTLLYNYFHPDVFDYIILRSPAIKMYDVVTKNILTEEMKLDLERQGYFNFGFERIIKIYQEFIENLKNNNILTLYQDKKLDNMAIIHGTEDDLVPIDDSNEFANMHNCQLFPIDGADHRYKKPGELDKVIDIAVGIIEKINNK